jgi:hypothetical protein
LPPGHPRLLGAQLSLGQALEKEGKTADAETAFRDLLQSAGDAHDATARSAAGALADLLASTGRADEASLLRKRYNLAATTRPTTTGE